jgi:hypothetical protein
MFDVADKVDESMEIVLMQVSSLRHVRACVGSQKSTAEPKFKLPRETTRRAS